MKTSKDRVRKTSTYKNTSCYVEMPSESTQITSSMLNIEMRSPSINLPNSEKELTSKNHEIIHSPYDIMSPGSTFQSKPRMSPEYHCSGDYQDFAYSYDLALSPVAFKITNLHCKS